MAPANSGLSNMRLAMLPPVQVVRDPQNEIFDRRTCMISNLIESSSHVKEFKRRGSFLAFTTATYLALFAVTGVVSIYAYDAHLGEQNLEITMLSPLDLRNIEAVAPKPVQHERDPSPPTRSGDAGDIRRNAVAPVDSTLAPDKVSAKPNPDLPVRNG